MSITGASQLSASIKERIAAAKKRVAQVHSSADTALSKLYSAADTAERIAVTIEKEADALLSEIGQYSNGGPPLDDEPETTTPTPLPPLGPINPIPGPRLAPGTLMGTVVSSQGEPKKNEGSF